jgi:hypothetical protein
MKLGCTSRLSDEHAASMFSATTRAVESELEGTLVQSMKKCTDYNLDMKS